MKKAVKQLKNTTISRVYNMAINELFLGCQICSPHRGCNRNRKNRDDSWKSYRKTQWKEKE